MQNITSKYKTPNKHQKHTQGKKPVNIVKLKLILNLAISSNSTNHV